MAAPMLDAGAKQLERGPRDFLSSGAGRCRQRASTPGEVTTAFTNAIAENVDSLNDWDLLPCSFRGQSEQANLKDEIAARPNIALAFFGKPTSQPASGFAAR